MFIRSIAVACVIAAMLPTMARADIPATERLAQNLQTCAGCHGAPAFEDPDVNNYQTPRLGGQQAGYIIKALKGYRTRLRDHEWMRGVASGLGEAEIQELAAYFSAAASFSGKTRAQEGASIEQLVRERCAACHGADGNQPSNPDYPRLAGQHKPYLEKALADYIAGHRRDPVMRAQVINTNTNSTLLTQTEITALADYFSRQAGLIVKP